jgi:hypothetical protein
MFFRLSVLVYLISEIEVGRFLSIESGNLVGESVLTLALHGEVGLGRAFCAFLVKKCLAKL